MPFGVVTDVWIIRIRGFEAEFEKAECEKHLLSQYCALQYFLCLFVEIVNIRDVHLEIGGAREVTEEFIEDVQVSFRLVVKFFNLLEGKLVS